MPNKNIPLSLKIISIVFYICSFFMLVFSGVLIFAFDKARSSLIQIPQIPFSKNISSGVQIGVIILVIAILFFFIGLGLWKRKKWSRIAALVFVSIGFIGSIVGISSGRWLSIIDLVLYGIIGFYLIWNKKIKEAFENNFVY